MGDVITKFKLETTQYDSKLRDATDRMKDLMRAVQVAGGSMNDLSAKDKELAKSFGTLSTGANNAKDKVRELANDLNKVGRAYFAMSKEMQQSDVGKAISEQMRVMKDRLTEAKKELYDVGDASKAAANGGMDFDSVLQALGGQLGINTNLLSGLASGTLATTAAVTAGATAVVAATKAWADYNDEMTRQNNITTVVTGLDGSAGEDLTIGVRALARTYDVDFRAAIEAANTLMQQFGVSGEEALNLLQDGMQGMIAGDGGKLLSMIQQYAPSFRDAGIQASQLVAIIQNSEGGLFTDQNMSAITMGIKNIRLMTKQTSEALAQLGIDGEEMTKKLNDGSMTIFEAMQQVAGAIENTGSSSQAAGQVMQQVFGRQGAMAGTKLGEAIATLNTNLEETKLQTGEVGENLRRVNDATVELERVTRQVFETAKWDEWATDMKVFAVEGLAYTVEWVGKYWELNKQLNVFLMGLKEAARLMGLIKGEKMDFGDIGKSMAGAARGAASSAQGQQTGFSITTDANGNVVKATRGGQDVTAEYLKSINTPAPTTTPTTTPKSSGKSSPSWAPIQMQAMPELTFGRSLADVNADMGKAQKAYETAGDEAGRAMAKALVEKLKDERDTMLGEGDVTKGGFADAYTHDFGKDLDKINKQEEKKEDKKEANLAKEIGQMAGGMQSIVGGIENLGIELPAGLDKMFGGIMSVVQVLQGISAIVAAIQVISAADTFIPFKNGGVVPHAAGGWVVPGTDFSDRTPILASSGEVVLNRAQVGNVASQLAQANSGGGNVQPYVNGEEIWLGVNNFLKRSGRGEIVTSR